MKRELKNEQNKTRKTKTFNIFFQLFTCNRTFDISFCYFCCVFSGDSKEIAGKEVIKTNLSLSDGLHRLHVTVLLFICLPCSIQCQIIIFDETQKSNGLQLLRVSWKNK